MTIPIKDYQYIMPERSHGHKNERTSYSYEDDLTAAVRAHMTTDPVTGKLVNESIVIHNAIINPDTRLRTSIGNTYKKLKRSNKNGGNNIDKL